MISQQVSSSDSTLIPIALSTLDVGADPNVRAVAVAGAVAVVVAVDVYDH